MTFDPERFQPTHSKRKAPAVRELLKEKKNRPSSPTVEQHISSNHDHCQCVESLKIKMNALKRDIAMLQENQRQLKTDHEIRTSTSDFCLDQFKDDDKKIRLYTRFVTYTMFMACFNFLSALMYVKFKELPMLCSKVDKYMPPCLKEWYPSTRMIIDATEFYIEKPSSLARQ